MGKVFKLMLALAACHVLAAGPAAAAGDTAAAQPAGRKEALTEGSLAAYTLPPVTIYGVADQAPTVPVMTRFGTQFNVLTEEQIQLQNSLDFYDALRNVPGVMYQKKNIIGGQTGPSLYIRGRGASHPSPDLSIFFDDVPRSGVLYGQALADGIPVYALGGMEIYKSPQPSRFGSGYGMINFIPKYMTEDGYELRLGFEAGSFGTVAENLGMGAKKDGVDIYAAQSFISTLGHEEHTAAHQASYYANLGFQFSENWSLRLMANRVDAETQSPNNAVTGSRTQGPSTYLMADRYDTGTSLATLSLNNTYDNARGYLKGYYNHTLFHIRGEDGEVATSRQTNVLYGLRGRETFSLWEGNEIVAGFDLDVTELQNDQRKYATDTTRSWDFPTQTLFSPYLAVSQTFGREEGFHVTPSAGIRLYTSDVFSDYASPQAGLVLGYANTNLSFAYARGVNYPSPVVLQGFLADRSLPGYLNTKDIKPEVVDHYEVALSHVRPGLFSASATYFHDDGRDRLRANMAMAMPVSDSFFNSSTAEYKIDGLELAGSVTPLDGLEIFAGATWLKAWAKGDDGKSTDKMPYTPSFALQAGFKWKFWEHFLLSGDYQHLQNVYAGNLMRGTPPKNPNSNFTELHDVDKLPDINVVNLRLDYLFSYDDLHLEEGRVFVAVNNVLNTPYAYAMQKTADNTDRQLYYMPGTSFMAGFELKF